MTKNISSGFWSMIFKVIFIFLSVFSLLIGLFLTSIAKSPLSDDELNIDYIDNWMVMGEDGQSFTAGRTYSDNRMYSEDFVIITKLPDHISSDSELCFQNRSNVSVYINGECRFAFDRLRDTGIPGGSVKEFYVTVPLGVEDSGGELRMIRGKTDWNPEIVPETFVTTSRGFQQYLLGKFGLSFFMSAILLIASLLVTVIGIVMRIGRRQDLNMPYGALGLLTVACWLISVSQLTSFFTGIYYVDGVMGFLFCMLMPFALLIYLNSLQKGRYRALYTALFVLSGVNFVLFTTLHFTGIQLLQTSLVYIDSVLGLIIVSVFVTMIIDVKSGGIRDYPYAAVGFLVFMIMALVEIAMLIVFQIACNEIPIVLGLLCLLVLIVVQQIDDIKRVRSRLEADLDSKVKEKEQMLIHVVQTLAGTIDAKDTYTKGHSGRVADYAREIARRYGYDEAQLNDIYMMGLLHDIGKIGIPDAVINKPGKLTEQEYEIIKKHPVMGARILENITEMPELSVGAKWHHEKFGGGGYPDGLSGEDIPEAVRIIAVADAYDAMTSYRSYRDPMPQERVKAEIKNGFYTQFDPRFAAIMLEMIKEDTNYDLCEKKTTSQN